MTTSESRIRTPIQRFGDDYGCVMVGWVADGTLYARLDGRVSDGLAALFASRLEGLLWPTGPEVQVFGDYWQLETYTSAAHESVTKVMRSHRERLASVDVLVRSKVVELGVRSMSMALGLMITVNSSPTEFMLRLEARAPEVRRLLMPSLKPRLVGG